MLNVLVQAMILLWGAVLFGAIAGLMELSQRNWRISFRVLLVVVAIVACTIGFTLYVLKSMVIPGSSNLPSAH